MIDPVSNINLATCVVFSPFWTTLSKIYVSSDPQRKDAKVGLFVQDIYQGNTCKGKKEGVREGMMKI